MVISQWWHTSRRLLIAMPRPCLGCLLQYRDALATFEKRMMFIKGYSGLYSSRDHLGYIHQGRSGLYSSRDLGLCRIALMGLQCVPEGRYARVGCDTTIYQGQGQGALTSFVFSSMVGNCLGTHFSTRCALSAHVQMFYTG